MRWYEYRMEVDELHASDALKASLLAMQPAAPAAAAAVPLRQPRKKAVRFPSKRVLSVSACFAVVLCGVFAYNMLGVRLFSAGSAASTAASSILYSRASVSAENGVEDYALSASDIAGTYDEAAVGTGAALTSSEARATADSAEKIIYTADLTLQSKDYDTARAALEEALAAAGGHMESSDEYTYTDSGSRHISLTLRVPEENYESFLAAVAEAGNVTYKSQQAEDVTTQYMDIETRLANLKAQRTRLEELQAEAESLGDLLEIESSLTDVQSQIESWQNQLDWYSNQVSCCTVYITLNEVEDYTVTGASFAEELAAAFKNGWANFVAGAQEAIVWLAGAWPVVIIIAAAAVAVVLVRKRRAGKQGK